MAHDTRQEIDGWKFAPDDVAPPRIGGSAGSNVPRALRMLAAENAKPNPGADFRGIVIPETTVPVAAIAAEPTFVRGIDDDHLRTMLLLFDLIDIPARGMISDPGKEVLTRQNGGLEFLEQAGAVVRTSIKLPDLGLGVDFDEVADIAAFRLHEQVDAGKWVIGRGRSSPAIPSDLLTAAQGFSIELLNAFPVFAREVPHEDILLFKEARRPELLALRHELGSISDELVRNGFSGELREALIKNFSEALINYSKVMDGSNRPTIVRSLIASINCGKFVEMGGKMALRHLMGLPLSASVPDIAGEGAAIVFRAANGMQGVRTGPFAYFSSAGRRLMR